jgi:hypothetical protein
MRSIQFTMAILFMLWMISYYSLDKTCLFMVLRGVHTCAKVCQSVLWTYFMIPLYMALLMDLNRGMLYVLQCLCLSLKSEAIIEVETQSLLQIMTVHPKIFWSLVVYLRGQNKSVLRPNTTREASNGWRTCGFSFCCLSGKFLVSWRWALKFQEVGVDYMEHFLLLWLFSQRYDSYQVEILT